jgi:hypothetical protein
MPPPTPSTPLDLQDPNFQSAEGGQFSTGADNAEPLQGGVAGPIPRYVGQRPIGISADPYDRSGVGDMR